MQWKLWFLQTENAENSCIAEGQNGSGARDSWCLPTWGLHSTLPSSFVILYGVVHVVLSCALFEFL